MQSILELIEYTPRRFPAEWLSAEAGERLWRRYGRYLHVEFPSPKTDGEWQLTAQGWVGRLPFTPEMALILHPKTPLTNLFHMWAYAYDLGSAHLPPGIVQADSLIDFYAQLAALLARGVLRRGRLGFHRAYLSRTEPQPVVHGRLQLDRMWRRPVPGRPVCTYDTFTTDIADNQILAYTLTQLARQPLPDFAATAVRQARRLITQVAAPHPVTPDACRDRAYTRLNEDYRPLHALCRFFLEHTAPAHSGGAHEMLPFLINMARLYERFVAAWLDTHLPPPWTVRAQETSTLGPDQELRFNIDLVLYDGRRRPRIVLDTKYKTAVRPDTADISQIVTYAHLQGSDDAILVYPTPLARPLDARLGPVRLRSLTFPLDGDLEADGQAFLQQLLQAIGD